mmetsp:Transcript_65802/g.189709  ORF Transcript_65802/g.189709 Transcript_65802/m.189709 type:complete len:695 (+) Transcript_65802:859-2943(+)
MAHCADDARDVEGPLRLVVVEQARQGRTHVRQLLLCGLLLSLGLLNHGHGHLLRRRSRLDGSRALLAASGLLRGGQRLVQAAGHLHELVVAAALHDEAALHHEDRVGIAHRAEAVGDGHRCQGTVTDARLADAVEGLLDEGLALTVQGAGRLVQKKHLWLPEHGSRDCDALLLPAGELRPTRAGEGLEFVRETVDEAGLRALEGLLKIVFRSARPPLQDVIPQRCGEQHGLLADIPDQGAQRLGRDIAHVDSIDKRNTLCRVVEALQEAHDGALSAATFTHKGELLSLFEGEADALQHGRLGLRGIGKPHFTKLEALEGRDCLPCVDALRLDGALVVHDLQEPGHGHATLVHDLHRGLHLPQEEAPRQHDEEDHENVPAGPDLPRAVVRLPVVDQRHAKVERCGDSEREAALHPTHAKGLFVGVLPRAHLRLPHCAPVLLDRLPLAPERDHRPQREERLLHHSRRLGVPALGLLGDLLHGLTHDHHACGHQWHGAENDKRELPAEEEAEEHGDEEARRALDALAELVAESLGKTLAVGAELRGQRRRAAHVVPRDVLVEHGLEVAGSHLQSLALREEAQAATLGPRRDERTRAHEEHQGDLLGHARARAADGINHAAEDVAQPWVRAAVHNRAENPEGEQEEVHRAGQAQHPAHRGGHLRHLRWLLLVLAWLLDRLDGLVGGRRLLRVRHHVVG